MLAKKMSDVATHQFGNVALGARGTAVRLAMTHAFAMSYLSALMIEICIANVYGTSLLIARRVSVNLRSPETAWYGEKQMAEKR